MCNRISYQVILLHKFLLGGLWYFAVSVAALGSPDSQHIFANVLVPFSYCVIFPKSSKIMSRMKVQAKVIPVTSKEQFESDVLGQSYEKLTGMLMTAVCFAFKDCHQVHYLLCLYVPV